MRKGRCDHMSDDQQRNGNGPVPGTRRKAVPIAMATGPAEYTAGQQELPLHLAPWLWSDLLRYRNDRSRVLKLREKIEKQGLRLRDEEKR